MCIILCIWQIRLEHFKRSPVPLLTTNVNLLRFYGPISSICRNKELRRCGTPCQCVNATKCLQSYREEKVFFTSLLKWELLGFKDIGIRHLCDHIGTCTIGYLETVYGIKNYSSVYLCHKSYILNWYNVLLSCLSNACIRNKQNSK